MQTLSPQYSTLYTRKFRVYYSDLVVESGTRAKVLLFTAPRNWEMLSVKIWIRQAFVGTSVSSCTGYVINGQNLSLTGEASRSPLSQAMLIPATDFSGNLETNEHGISNQSSDNDFYFRVVTNSIVGGPVFSAGYFDIWVITCRMP